MAKFEYKNINSIESLGERLRQHREDLNVTLEQASRQMQLSPNYLKKIESDDFDKLPADIYTIKFLQQYADFLNLNPETVVEQFEKERTIYRNLSNYKPPKQEKQTRLKKILHYLLNPKFIRYVIIFVVSILVVIYLGYQVNKIFAPPELIIKEPYEQSIITDQHSLTLSGITESEVELKINDRLILIDQSGRFDLDIDLQNGLNIIKISAKKKHSKANIQYRQIIVENN